MLLVAGSRSRVCRRSSFARSNAMRVQNCGSDCGNTRKYFANNYKELIGLYQNLTTATGGKPRVVGMIPPPDGNMTNQTWEVAHQAFGVPAPCPPEPANQCPPFVSFVNCTDPTTGRNENCVKAKAHYNADTACVINCVLPELLPNIFDEVGIKSADRVDLQTLLGGPNNTDRALMPQLHPDCGGYQKIGEHIASSVFGIKPASTP